MAVIANILGYWVGMALVMWVLMYGALTFARACEFVVDRLFR